MRDKPCEYKKISGISDVADYLARFVRISGADLSETERSCALFIVSDTNVEKFWGIELKKALYEAEPALRPVFLALPPGETSKNPATLMKVLQVMALKGMLRNSTVAALGGGVVGDIAGLAASLYMRGVNFMQIPTTLLAMADSSIGGKNGVDMGTAKNIIGTFYMPAAVLTRTDYLQTLPMREWSSGMSEVIKTALLGDPALFADLEKALGNRENPGVLGEFLLRGEACEAKRREAMLEKLAEVTPEGLMEAMAGCQEKEAQVMSHDGTSAWEDCWNDDIASLMASIVERAALVKRNIIEKDPFDKTGVRACLNLGHTLGHALENAAGYGVLSHGEAVGLGMLASVNLSERLGVLEEPLTKKLKTMFSVCCLPVSIPGFISWDNTLKAMNRDKKREGSGHTFIVPLRIGMTDKIGGISEDMIKSVFIDLTQAERL
ncbi:MAG: 3-dehydroquinate synthase [bacterium]|nr:3-dehydroquinate synthase [bacterium]